MTEETLTSFSSSILQCTTLQSLTQQATQIARKLTGAEGATFILRDDDMCHYVDEDAISPLWKGKRFPMHICISGWAMLNKEAVIIENIYEDGRIAIDAYSPTFVKSLAMVPVNVIDPIAAIGVYWSSKTRPTQMHMKMFKAFSEAVAQVLKKIKAD